MLSTSHITIPRGRAAAFYHHVLPLWYHTRRRKEEKLRLSVHARASNKSRTSSNAQHSWQRPQFHINSLIHHARVASLYFNNPARVHQNKAASHSLNKPIPKLSISRTGAVSISPGADQLTSAFDNAHTHLCQLLTKPFQVLPLRPAAVKLQLWSLSVHKSLSSSLCPQHCLHYLPLQPLKCFILIWRQWNARAIIKASLSPTDNLSRPSVCHARRPQPCKYLRHKVCGIFPPSLTISIKRGQCAAPTPFIASVHLFEWHPINLVCRPLAHRQKLTLRWNFRWTKPILAFFQ